MLLGYPHYAGKLDRRHIAQQLMLDEFRLHVLALVLMIHATHLLL